MKYRYFIAVFVLFCQVGLLRAQSDFRFTRYHDVPVIVSGNTLDMAWAGGINYAQFSNIDLNDDGIQDLFLFDRTGNKVLTFVHLPGVNTLFRYAPEYEAAFPPMQNWALLRDYNCDGKPDIFTHTPGGIRIYRNTSSGGTLSFQLETSMLRSQQFSNYVNLYVSSVDIPGLADVDGDGDLDVLTFGIFGTSLEYHRNYSVENGYGCDSLQFAMVNQCWGCFSESVSSNDVTLFDTCANFGIPNPELPRLIEEATQKDSRAREGDFGQRHVGACSCVLDVDDDGMPDLLMGGISFSNQVLVINGGTTPNTNSCMDSLDASFPSYDIPVNLKTFPCAYQVDVNNDNKPDIVLTPQQTAQAENAKGVLYYTNVSTDNSLVLNFTSGNLLQNQMIERGEGAFPVLHDYDGDGLPDLFVANFGFFHALSDSYKSRLALYRNTGTPTDPKFTWVTDNFANLEVEIALNNLYPAFGDLNDDGAPDMVVGNESGTLSYFRNTAAAGTAANYVLQLPAMVDENSVLISAGQYSAPLLVDLNRDGLIDLVLGGRNGRLTYYENVGTASSFVFRKITDFLGQVNVKEWWDNTGYSVPAIFEKDGEYQLFVGSKSGYIHHYNAIEANLSGTFNRVDTTLIRTPEGIRSTCAVYDLDNDGFVDMITGNYRGGLTYYKGDPQGSSAVREYKGVSHFSLFPNPSSSLIHIRSALPVNDAILTVYNLTGQQMTRQLMRSNTESVDISNFPAGIYLLEIRYGTSSETLRFVRAAQ